MYLRVNNGEITLLQVVMWGPFRPICNYKLHSDRDLRERSK